MLIKCKLKMLKEKHQTYIIEKGWDAPQDPQRMIQCYLFN